MRRTNLTCQQNGLRLSWPRNNDRRRFIVSVSTSPSTPSPTLGHASNARFVHTSNWDIELYHHLTSSVPIRPLSLLDGPMSWNLSTADTVDRDLPRYFCCVASESLATFGQDATALGNILLRIAIEGDILAPAVRHALLAFSLLHRYGLQAQAVELKIAALESLAEVAIASELCAKDAMQHIATGMLLCSFEIHHLSRTSVQWWRYLRGVNTIISSSSNNTLLEYGPDAAALLDWVHYHNVLARFSLLHWRREGAPDLASIPPDIFLSEYTTLDPPIFSMLNLLSQICDTISLREATLEPGDDVNGHKSFLKILDWRIRFLPIPKVSDGAGDDDHAISAMQLYQLAMLLYLNRSFQGLIGETLRMQQQIDQAFAILTRLRSCKQHFPIYVIGCEARTDEQRVIVLDIISRTEKLRSSRSFTHCKSLLQAVWAQDDLAKRDYISYCDKFIAVMSQCEMVPTFV